MYEIILYYEKLILCHIFYTFVTTIITTWYKIKTEFLIILSI